MTRLRRDLEPEVDDELLAWRQRMAFTALSRMFIATDPPDPFRAQIRAQMTRLHGSSDRERIERMLEWLDRSVHPRGLDLGAIGRNAVAREMARPFPVWHPNYRGDGND